VREALAEPVRAIVESVLDCLSQAPPELAQDLIVNGIHLVGGGSLLAGFDQRIAQETQVEVRVVDAPLEAVVLGAGKCLENFDLLRSVFMADRY
jgi:rod shape-determining protein MreB